MKLFDVWSVDPSNLVGEFATEVAALDAVRTLLSDGWSHGQLSLGWGDSEDEDVGGTIATGAVLGDLVRQSGAPVRPA